MKSRGKSKRTTAKTSWGGVADWYEGHLERPGTYHETVIAPNVLRLLASQKGKPILEIGCGEGYVARLLKKEGHTIVGSDISKELIQKARMHDDHIPYHVAAAKKLAFSGDGVFSAVLAVLALQNMESIEPVFLETARVLQPRGRFVVVLNHPAFRIPKRSSWGFDIKTGVQYRRLDGYLSASRERLDMTPGRKQSGELRYTFSFHRSLQDYSKALSGAGFAITRMEEWISSKASEPGPRSEAENRARKEFPLFLAIEAVKIVMPMQL